MSKAITSRTHVTQCEDETLALGRALAADLTPPRCVLLTGELGAGKTTLTKGIAAGMGAARHEDVTSPTFTLIHEYRGKEATVYHIDLYRIEKQRELESLGLEELMQANSVLLIEWGEKFPWVIERCDTRITISRSGENERKIMIVESGK